MPEKRNRRRQSKIIINIFENQQQKKFNENKIEQTNIHKNTAWYKRFFSWFISVIILFLKWIWKHPKKIITTCLAALFMWLASFFSFKIPFLPLGLPIPKIEKSEQKNNNAEQNKKSENQTTNSSPQDKEQKVSTQYITNIINQTNILTQTNFVTETKYITNFVIQPIVITNTIYKEVPITVTNVLVIKQNSSNNQDNNKNSVITGPAFYFTEDFNTLFQNQQQNPIRSKPIN